MQHRTPPAPAGLADIGELGEPWASAARQHAVAIAAGWRGEAPTWTPWGYPPPAPVAPPVAWPAPVPQHPVVPAPRRRESAHRAAAARPGWTPPLGVLPART
ncbi:hypothetical protein [Actinomycetospora straminea]|nr:hypothetical protein [Actinomycetospora straminea]MDD7934367.1 hypothetical protein [Actinomycetospora straminea]